jgi:uncharacterized protein (DUF2147 family)
MQEVAISQGFPQRAQGLLTVPVRRLITTSPFGPPGAGDRTQAAEIAGAGLACLLSAPDSVRQTRWVEALWSDDMTRHLMAAAAFLVLTGTGSAIAADPIGTWLTQGGNSRVRIADCGGALCGTIVWLKEPNDAETKKPKTDKNNSDASKRSRPLIGVQIVLGMKPAGTGKWSGQVYNAEDGKTYSGNLTVNGGNALTLQGCALGGLVCKGQNWTKVN